MKPSNYPTSDKTLSERIASVIFPLSIAALVVLAFSDSIPWVNEALWIKRKYRPQKEIPSLTPIPVAPTEPFSSQNFLLTLDTVLTKATQWLKYYYKTENVLIKIRSHTRTFEEQKKLFLKKRSKTIISLHNYDAASDIDIRINNIYQPWNSLESALPYQIVWYFAKEAELFWWWAQDVGHIWVTEYPAQLLELHPELIQDSITQQALRLLLQETPLERKYKPFIDITKHPYTWGYIPNKWITWWYLPTINPYTHKKWQ